VKFLTAKRTNKQKEPFSVVVRSLSAELRSTKNKSARRVKSVCMPEADR
jgi:hypothetical protein